MAKTVAERQKEYRARRKSGNADSELGRKLREACAAKGLDSDVWMEMAIEVGVGVCAESKERASKYLQSPEAKVVDDRMKKRVLETIDAVGPPAVATRGKVSLPVKRGSGYSDKLVPRK